MKKFFSALAVLCVLNTHAQIKALTDEGKEVVLFENGTWKYVHDNGISTKTDTISINPKALKKSNEASFLVKSKTFNIGIFINPVKWTFERNNTDNDKSSEYTFSLKTDEAYATLITEKTPIDLENMRTIALMNAQSASVDVEETLAEYRIVNNKKILCLEMKGTIKGIKFIYLGYYFCNENGTAQLVSYVAQNQYGKLKDEMTTLLNGLTEIKN
jgi:hypothetical protein